MKSKTIALIIIFFACVASAFSQRTITKSNVFMGPFFKTIYTTQEVKIVGRFTINTSVKTRPPLRYGFGLGGVRVAGSDYDPFAGGLKMSGIGNITEFRFYGKEKGAFNGFYWGPYTSYMHYKIYSEPIYSTFSNSQGQTGYADITQELKVNIFGGGFEIGVQKMYLNNHLCVDWTILGVGLGGLRLEGSILATNTSEGFDLRDYADETTDKNFAIEGLFHINKNTNQSSVDLSLGTPFFLCRTGLNIGFGY